MRHRTLIVLGLACFTLGRYESALAATSLSFDSSSYTVKNGQTVQVQVFLSQTSGGPIGPGNGLAAAAVQVSFNNPAGIAAVLSTSNITGGPLFDSSTASLTSTQASVAENSLSGIITLPVLLGTFTYTGLKVGATQISVSAIPPPGTSFGTIQGPLPDPTGATANINVIPEPASLIIVLTGGPFLIGGLALRRRPRWLLRAA
jgi:hypothetical protein